MLLFLFVSMTYKYGRSRLPSWAPSTLRSALLPSSLCLLLRKQPVRVQCDLAPLTLPEPVSILPNSPHLTLLTLRVFLSSSISPFQCRCSVPKGSPFMTSFNWYLSFQPLRCCYCCCCMTETGLSLGEKKKGPFSCIFFCHAISSTSANNK